MGYEYHLEISVADENRNVAWRMIRVNGDLSLDELCEVIMFAFSFVHEHAYEYLTNDKILGENCYTSIDDDNEPSTSALIDSIRMEKGQIVTLHYDFSDNWMFKIKVVKIFKVKLLRNPWAILDGEGFVLQYPTIKSETEEDEKEAIAAGFITPVDSVD